ncbi:MAG: hypothetical protein KC503_22005 [Myxococcales bacterium]|nr:hypothetical protein [Myxococcales bacterium]
MRSQPMYVAGELFAFPLADERWGGLQIVHIDDIGGPEVVALDYVGVERPTREELARAKPLWMTHHAHGGAFCRVRVAGRSHPWDFVALGMAPLVASFEDRSSAWSDWSYPRYQVLAQWRWDHEVDESVRAAFKSNNAGQSHVEVNVGGDMRRVDRATRQLALLPRSTRAGASWQLPLGSDVDWDELAVFSSVMDLTCVGRDEAVLELAAQLPLLERFVWRAHRQREIDLSALRAREVIIDAGQTLTITLPPSVQTLSINSSRRTQWVAIDDPFEGRRLELVLRDPMPHTVAGPAALRRLRASSLSRAPCPRFARIRALRELELSGAPGTLLSPASLTELPELRQLTLSDFYAIAGDVPPRADWPALDTLSYDGLRDDDAEMLRARMRGLRRLEISPRHPMM